MFRELKSRKARFGWDLGALHLGNVVEMGQFVESIQTQFDPIRFNLEEQGWGSSSSIKLYTDHDDVAEWIRSYKP